MGHHFTELVEQRAQIERVILVEEERFQSTLARGMDLLEETFEGLRKSSRTLVPGEELLRLHDTCQLRWICATDIATDRGFQVDREGFEAAMNRQRQQARSTSGPAAARRRSLPSTMSSLLQEIGETKFVGYDAIACTARIAAIVKDGQRVDRLNLDERGEIILDQTPFYADSGGQVGDTGTSSEGGAHVSGAKAPVGKMTLHAVRVTKGALKVGDVVDARVDETARTSTQNHHTATHLLQAALRDILGDHVHQAGCARFAGSPSLRLHPLRGNRRGAPAGHRAYGQSLHPHGHSGIDYANGVERSAYRGWQWRSSGGVRGCGAHCRVGDISMELCGGTHVPNTGTIGYFKIVSESSISAGVRRIEAVCGEPSVDLLQLRERTLMQTARQHGALR